MKEVIYGNYEKRENRSRDRKGQGQNRGTADQTEVEAENSEIVDIVRGMSIPLAELPLVLQQLRAGKTLGQNVPKSEEVAAE